MSVNSGLQIEQPKSTLPLLRQLRWNLILYFILLAVIPMALTVVFALNQAIGQTRDQIRNQLESIVELKQDQLTRWLNDSQAALDQFLSDSSRTSLLITLVVSPIPESPEQIDALYQAIQISFNDQLYNAAMAQPLIEELFVYNVEGEIVTASNPVQIGKTVVRQPYFANSLSGDVIQTPYYELGSGELTLFVTIPLIEARSDQVVGVLAARLDTQTLAQIMTERTGLGDSGETYLVSLENNYLLTPSRFEAEGYSLTRAYHSDGIDQALQQQDGAAIYESYREVRVIGVFRWLPELQVAMLAEVDEAEALVSFVRTRNITIGIAGLAALGAIIIGLYAAARISKPVSALTEVATQIAGGDLKQRARIRQGNEIGVLAVAFNRMTDQLQDLIGSLEQRVADRTRRLEIVATLGERLSAILKLEELLREVVNQIKDNFGYYHAHIYLLDDKRERLIMTEGTGQAGIELKARGHNIPLNAPTSLVARAARTGEIVRVDNVREAADWLPNLLLPDTYAEMAVPVILRGQVVGVLDVQENKIAGLDEGDENLLRSLANQIAVAIRNAQLFQEVEAALADAHAAQERYLEQAWEKVKITPLGGQYLYAQPNAAPLDETKRQTLAEAQQQALSQSHPAVVSLNDDDSTGKSLIAPINLRNKTIGALQLHTSDKERSWTEDDLAVIEAVIDQMAQTAENLRLFDKTHERASREQTIREITEKMRSAISLEELVKITAEAVGERLLAGHAVVELGVEAKSHASRMNNGQRSE